LNSPSLKKNIHGNNFKKIVISLMQVNSFLFCGVVNPILWSLSRQSICVLENHMAAGSLRSFYIRDSKGLAGAAAAG